MDIMFDKQFVLQKWENISRIIRANGKIVLYRSRKSGQYKVHEFDYDYFIKALKCIKCSNALLTATTSNFLHDFELTGVKEVRKNCGVISAYIDDVNFYKIRGKVNIIEEVEIVEKVENDIDI